MQVLKYATVIALLFICSQNIYAQKMAYGVNVGLNYSSGYGNGLDGKLNLGYGGGIWSRYSISKTFKFQPELWLTQYNYTKADDFDKYYMNDVGRIGADTKIRLANINLPLLMKYEMMPWLSVFAGPQVGLVVFEDENLRKDGVDAFKKSELSLLGGAEVNLGSVGFFGRFTQGLSDISNMGNRYKWNSQHVDFGISLKIR